MKWIAVGLPVLLAACGSSSSVSSPTAATGTLPTSTPGITTASSSQVQTLQSISQAASTASQVGAAIGNPAVAGAGAAVAAAADSLTTTTQTAPTAPTNPAFVYADVYVDLTDPAGLRVLVPYLIKPEVWMLIQMEDLSSGTKHYRFQRVSTGGPQMPEVNIFKTNK